MQTLDDIFNRETFHRAIERGSLLLFDNAGVRVVSDDLERALRWYSARLRRSLEPADHPPALRAWILEGRPDE